MKLFSIIPVILTLTLVGCGGKLSPERQAAIKLNQAVEVGKRVRVTTQDFEKAKIIKSSDAKIVYGKLLATQEIVSDLLIVVESMELLGNSPDLESKLKSGLDVLTVLYPETVKDIPVQEVKSKLLVILDQSTKLINDIKSLEFK